MSVGWEGVLVFAPKKGGGGKGTPLIICAAEQAMVFKVLSLKQGVQLFQYEASWTGCRFGLEAFNEC